MIDCKDFKRLIEYVKYKYSVSQSDIADKIGAPKQMLSDYMNGRVKDTTNLYNRISKAYSGIDEERKENRVEAGLPLVPIEAVAGFNGVDFPGIKLSECDNYCVPDFVSAGAEYLIRVSGSSMYPKYSSGDILACRKVPDITFFQWGKVYVIDSNQGAMVKRLFPCDNNPEAILCRSENERYPAFELPKTEIRSLSIVIGAIRLE